MISNYQSHCLISNDLHVKLQSEKIFHSKCLAVLGPDSNSLQSLLLHKISPYIIVIIACTNSLVCIVLSRANMITPTNIILLAMAISDMLTGLFPFPIYVMYNYISESSFIFQNTFFAYVNFYLTSIFPTTFHTASVWLTVTLAIQRVIYVKFPNFVTVLCTNKISAVTGGLIFFLALAMHSVNFTYFFEKYYHIYQNNKSYFVEESKMPIDSNWGNFSLCLKMMKCNNSNDSVLFWYSSLRIIFLHVVPCISLTILTILLLIVLKRKSNLSKKLLKTKNRKTSIHEHVGLNVSGQNKATNDYTPGRLRTANKDSSNSTSKMLVVVLLIFLSVEIPMGLVITLYVILKSINAISSDKHWFHTTNICNFLLLISYPFNFVIYCIMSKKFRDTFKETLCPNRIYNIITNSNND